MNKALSIVLLLVLSVTHQLGYSQSNTEQDKPSGEFSINITETITRFSRNPITSEEMRDNFMLMYKRPNVNNTQAVRFGFNADYLNDKGGNNSQLNKREIFQLFLSLGIERRHIINKKFNYYYGFDAFFFQQDEKVETSSQGFPVPQSFTINTNSFNIGLAPLFGFKWQINDRVSVFTESYLRTAYTFRLVNMEGSNFPKQETDRAEGAYLKLLMPTNIHFAISL